MEYKSEIINFEKEAAESKKRMLGSDKVNKLDEIKKSREEFVKVNEHILELANKQFSGLTLKARIKHDAFMECVDGLLAKLEQAEKDNDELKKLLLKSSDGFRTNSYSKEEIELIATLRTEAALQAIRKGD